MNIILRNSTINFESSLPPGTLVDLHPDFSGNPDYPSSEGYYFNASGGVSQIPTYANKVKISKRIPISPDNYTKIRVTHVIENNYHSICVFYSANGTKLGNIRYPYNSEAYTFDDVESTIPEGTAYILFENNVNGSGMPQSGAEYYAVV